MLFASWQNKISIFNAHTAGILRWKTWKSEPPDVKSIRIGLLWRFGALFEVKNDLFRGLRVIFPWTKNFRVVEQNRKWLCGLHTELPREKNSLDTVLKHPQRDETTAKSGLQRGFQAFRNLGKVRVRVQWKGHGKNRHLDFNGHCVHIRKYFIIVRKNVLLPGKGVSYFRKVPSLHLMFT